MKKEAAFKPYAQHQLSILPINLDEMIPANHMVRVVDAAIERMNCEPLFAQYPGGGTSAYHPVMLLKVIVYAYADKIYSSRRIAKATRENINFLWLTGNVQLDHMTINRFRGERLKGIIDEIFTEVVELLLREKYISFEKYFLDGTKIEANASKYSWVWGKNTKRYKEGLRKKVVSHLRKKVVSHLREIEMWEAEEQAEYGESDLPETGEGRKIDSAAIREVAARIDERLATKPTDRTLKKAKKTFERDYLPRMEKYENQETILNERNSYSKTDTEATFMRMKEDHMRNGQLKPGYNIQIGTENQFVTGYSIHQQAGDTSCMKEHFEKLKSQHDGRLPNSVTADAGYGSEENYEYLENEQVEHFVKYNTFHKEQSKKWKNDILRIQNWNYDEELDEYICAYGRRLKFVYERKEKSRTGYESLVRIYECDSCNGCPYRNKCVPSEKPDANRKLYINRRRNELRKKARDNLMSDKGLQMRSERPIEVESVFGNIKGNFGVRRFLLRGLEKVGIEWGLCSIAHNVRKMAALSA